MGRQQEAKIYVMGIMTLVVERPNNAVGFTYSMISVKFVKGGPL